MNKNILTAAVSTAALLFASGAWANDESGGDLYTTIFAGAAFGDDLELSAVGEEEVESLTFPLETGYLLGWTLGYDNLFGAGGFDLRPEVELSFRQQDVNFSEIAEAPEGFSLPTDVLTLFANLWIDFELNGVTPYVGGGIGVGWADLPLEGIHLESTDMVWQFGGGLNFDLNEHVFVGVGYRYLGANFEESPVDPGFDFEYEYRAHEAFGNLGVRF